jgi:hypothetical protein
VERKLLAIPVFLGKMDSVLMKELQVLMPFELAHHHLSSYVHPASN